MPNFNYSPNVGFSPMMRVRAVPCNFEVDWPREQKASLIKIFGEERGCKGCYESVRRFISLASGFPLA
jgi:hypothetical protein